MGCVWGLGEAFGSISSQFSWILSEKSIFWYQIKKSKKLQKIAFLVENRFFKNCFKLFKIMIYAMKWVLWVSYTCFKTIFAIRTCLETILGKSIFWSIFKIFTCGLRAKNLKKPRKTAKNHKNRFFTNWALPKKFLSK